MFQHVWGLFMHPEEEWKSIRKQDCTIGRCYCTHVLMLAAIPPLAGFIGTTQIGWRIGGGDPVTLSINSALGISILYFITLLVGVFTIGKSIHWMGKTYGANVELPRAIGLAAYTATPLFVIGLMGLYPILWLNLLVGLPALAYTVYLLYLGVPIMMDIEQERGFLFSSAVLAVGLVALVAMMAATVILWDVGAGPAFVN